MGKLYDNVYTEFTAKKATRETIRQNRARSKAFEDSLKTAFLVIAGEGESGCLLRADVELAVDEARVAVGRVDGFRVVDIPADLFSRVVARLEDPLDFFVGPHSVGIVKVSWEVPGGRPDPEVVDGNVRG